MLTAQHSLVGFELAVTTTSFVQTLANCFFVAFTKIRFRETYLRLLNLILSIKFGSVYFVSSFKKYSVVQ